MKKIANVLIIAGIIVFFYPLLDRAFTWYWQQRIFHGWEESLVAGESSLDENALAGEPEETPEETMGEEETPDPFLGLSVTPLGILEIKKIDLRLPVLRGASLANLKIGAGLLEDTAEIGAPGNTVLTAHRSYTYGRFFNRLDEIEAGDEIVIANAQENTYRYVVYNKVIVEPDDTSVTRGNEEERILTLVTCHPIHNATHRLIVQARIEQVDDL